MRHEGSEEREQQEASLRGSGSGMASGSAARPRRAQDRLSAAAYSP
jgi:hypothetical protein